MFMQTLQPRATNFLQLRELCMKGFVQTFYGAANVYEFTKHIVIYMSKWTNVQKIVYIKLYALSAS